jgi:hypothetical protein
MNYYLLILAIGFSCALIFRKRFVTRIGYNKSLFLIWIYFSAMLNFFSEDKDKVASIAFTVIAGILLFMKAVKLNMDEK